MQINQYPDYYQSVSQNYVVVQKQFTINRDIDYYSHPVVNEERGHTNDTDCQALGFYPKKTYW